MKPPSFDVLLGQIHDSGVYFVREDAVADLRSAAAAKRIRCTKVSLRQCRDKKEFLDRLASAFKLPSYFGRNWDALADALSDLRQGQFPGRLLLLRSGQAMRRHAPEEFKIALEVFQAASNDWSDDKVPFWVFVSMTQAEFDGLDRTQSAVSSSFYAKLPDD